MTDFTPAHWTLSKWLAAKTSTSRHSIVACIDSHQPTLSDIRCRRLLIAHLQFFHLVAPLYDDANLRRMFYSFLADREVASFKRQLDRDNQHELPISLHGGRVPSGLLPRIGWLYATEFVDRGLTRLLADTPTAPLNVDVNSEASRLVWQAFRDQLDRLELSDRDEENLARGACSALATYSGFFNSAFESY